ncbi:magnesium/cobalt transporter CorA [Skermania piniformis]|uniref:Magnesium transport protein CorA n=1 Tax=Skermania pinensis TaxID=39122 RepID=A0ABX8SCT1_9ACTN|nr:magnesium/cobalt transporter CorA [Skermania piniformis]QXQ15715.1 magnesium/cobalt transporter CorA [Skermania piniformis]
MNAAVIDCAVYLDGVRVAGTFTPCEAVARVREQGEGFVWVGLWHPDEQQMNEVAQCFGLHPLAVEDAVQAHQRPKLDRYDDLCFLVLRTVHYVEHDMHTVSEIVETGEIMIFVGPEFVVTVRHGEFSGLRGVRDRLELRPEVLAVGPFAVLHAIADHVVDSYIEVADHVEGDVDAMEEEVFDPRTLVAVAPIYQLKREVVEFRRAVLPLATALQELIQPGIAPKEVRRYLRDVVDHQTSVADRIAEFDESLSALIGAAQAMVSLRQNTDMRKISAWVAIAAVPTAIAGCYGMNFDNMPELHWHYGYFLALGVMLSACVGLFVTFRHNNWL